MKGSDICFYMSITKEENSSLMIESPHNQNLLDEDLNLVNNSSLARKLSFRRTSFGSNHKNEIKSLIKCKIDCIFS
jgi:hypothetical protein